MTFARTSELLAEAGQRGCAVGAFNVIHLETAEAIVAGAESAGRPVILQLSENCVRYHGAIEPITLASLAIARAASVPVAVHFDHAEDEELARRAVDLGFASVMYDGGRLDYAENVAVTARFARYAHAAGVDVEAELGEVGGKDGAHAAGVRTDPSEAAAFVAATGVDSLAVAVGSSHAMSSRVASLDLDLVARLRDAVEVPLVLHGSSGVPDDQLTAAIGAGMRKINVSTLLGVVFTAAVRETLAGDESLVDSRRYVAAGRDAVSAEVARLLRLFAPNAN